MSNCLYCLEPLEPGGEVHQECLDLKNAGWTEAQLIARAKGRIQAVRGVTPTLTRKDIVLAVFWGNLATLGVLLAAGIVIGIFAAVIRST